MTNTQTRKNQTQAAAPTDQVAIVVNPADGISLTPTTMDSLAESAVAIAAGAIDMTALAGYRDKLDAILAADDAGLQSVGIKPGLETATRDWATDQLIVVNRAVDNLLDAARRKSYHLLGEMAAKSAGIVVDTAEIQAAANDVRKAIKRAGSRQEVAPTRYSFAFYYVHNPNRASHVQAYATLKECTDAAHAYGKRHPNQMVAVYTGGLRLMNVNTLRTYHNGDAI